MFSVGVIYSARDFLKHISELQISTDQFKKAFEKYKYSKPEIILDLCFKCGWSYLSVDGSIVLTERGKEISNYAYSQALLLQLEDMISVYNPTWASLLPKGREETKHFLPENVFQCFKEAGLFSEISDDLIKFWDKLAVAYRNYKQKKLLDIGRKGERLSIDYEEKRTGNKPVWQSVESNLSGFDLLSTIDRGNTTTLMIEVKATTADINYANFYISKNEWLTAKNSHYYLFHLWLINRDENTLFISPVSSIENHIPKEFGEGEWQSVSIPFISVCNDLEAISF